MAGMMMALLAAATIHGPAPAQADSAIANPAPGEKQVCQMVVGPEARARPYKMCLTRAQWKAKKVADAKDANRIVCRYEQEIGSRFRTAKICAPASEWTNQRMRDREAIEQIQSRTCVPGAGC